MEGVWDLGIVEAPLTKVNGGPRIGARSPKPSIGVFRSSLAKEGWDFLKKSLRTLLSSDKNS